VNAEVVLTPGHRSGRGDAPLRYNGIMRSEEDVRAVFRLSESGQNKSAIARITGVSRAQVRAWLRSGEDAVLHSPMRTRPGSHADGCCQLVDEVPHREYAYLLGQYLGDGNISVMANGVQRLRVTMCDAYPGIRLECVRAIGGVMPGRKIGAVQRIGCSDVWCFSRHWVCLFPQHGPGAKHRRPITLEPWQIEIVMDEHPDQFVRGLIHSDGCRAINRVRRPTLAGPKSYAYPRYFFSNESADIRNLFMAACERFGVDSRPNRRNSVSVARRESVAILERVVGPKS
jgi:hypothetical protein